VVLTEEQLFDLAEVFKIFGDTTRIKILYALLEGEVCVGDIAKEVGMNQSAISHQLRLLKANKLVKFRREGKLTYYSLDDTHVEGILNLGMDHVLE
jgi:ArsR family transcriptional regulator